jgi:hypothetical protein
MSDAPTPSPGPAEPDPEGRTGVAALHAGRLERDFKRLGRGARRQRDEGLVQTAVGFALGMAVALWVARSNPWVLAYAVVAVGGATVLLGLLPLRRLLATIMAECAALQEVARLLTAKSDAGALLAHLQNPSAQGEGRSEALEQVLLAAQAERAGTTSPPAFVQVESVLDRVGFIRNGVVLLGLFGTVLFFTISLATEGQLSAQTFGALLEHVRGALACTMVGIASSLALGLAASRAAALYDELVQSTGALLSGPVAVAVASAPVRRSVLSESDLWVQVLTEIQSFTGRAAAVQKGVGDGVHAHVKALEALAQKLEAAPAFNVPEGVGQFAPAAERFEQGVSLLHQAVGTLVELVGKVSVQAPVASLERLGGIEGMQKQLEERTLQSVAAAHDDLRETRAALGVVAGEVAALRADQSLALRVEQLARERVEAESRIAARLGEVEVLARGAAGSAAAAESLAQEILTARTVDPRPITAGLEAVAGGQAAAGRAVVELRAELREFTGRVSPLVEELHHADEAREALAGTGALLRDTVDDLRAEAAGLRQGVEVLATNTGSIRAASDEVAAGAAALRQATSDLQERGEHTASEQAARLQQLDARLARGFGGLNPLLAWQRRMSSAPLVRLLSFQLPGWLVRFVPHRRNRPSSPSRTIGGARWDTAAWNVPGETSGSPSGTSMVAVPPDRDARPQGLLKRLLAFFSPGGSERRFHLPRRDALSTLPASPGTVIEGAPITVHGAPAVAETPDRISTPAQSSAPGWILPGQYGVPEPAVPPTSEAPIPLAPPANEPPPASEAEMPERAPAPTGREVAPNAARPFDEAGVREVYALWARHPEPSPEFPSGWEVVPLRFVRNAQEHAAARPVPLFADADQIADFVRFSPADGDEGLVLPHPEAAHSAEVVKLLFPGVDAAALAQPEALVPLAPVRVSRNGAYWEVER